MHQPRCIADFCLRGNVERFSSIEGWPQDALLCNPQVIRAILLDQPLTGLHVARTYTLGYNRNVSGVIVSGVYFDRD